MKQALSFILLCFIAFFCHAVDLGDVESYELLPIQFNRQVEIISEKVAIRNFKTEVEIEILCENSAALEASIVCMPFGYGRSYTDMLIPKDFEIFEGNEKIDFFVLYEGKKYTPKEASSIAGYHPSKIRFRLTSANRPLVLKLSYYNTSIIKLLEKWGYGFVLMNYRFASKESQKNVVVKYGNNTEALILHEVLSINDYANDLFWTSDAEKECDMLRVISTNNEIHWECTLPKDTAQLEVVFESGYMDLSYNNRFSLEDLDILENLIGYRHLFFLPKECLEILRNSFYAIHGYDFRNQKWKDYFSKMYEKNDFDYMINPNFSESDFNETERKNIELIRKIESMKEPKILSDFLAAEADGGF